MLGTAVPNNMPTLVFFHVSAPCIHTQCVGGRPLFRVGLKPGIFPKLKSPPTLTAGYKHRFVPKYCSLWFLFIYYYNTTGSLESTIGCVPKIACCLTDKLRCCLIKSNFWINNMSRMQAPDCSIATCGALCVEVPFSCLECGSGIFWLRPCYREGYWRAGAE